MAKPSGMLTAERRRRVAELYAEGYTPREIVAALGEKRSVIRSDIASIRADASDDYIAVKHQSIAVLQTARRRAMQLGQHRTVAELSNALRRWYPQQIEAQIQAETTAHWYHHEVDYAVLAEAIALRNGLESDIATAAVPPMASSTESHSVSGPPSD